MESGTRDNIIIQGVLREKRSAVATEHVEQAEQKTANSNDRWAKRRGIERRIATTVDEQRATATVAHGATMTHVRA
jgi:hypothetical protein